MIGGLLLLPALFLACATTAPLGTPRVPEPPIITAAEWGSQPQPISPERHQTPQRITIHHAGVLWNAGDDPLVKIRGLQTWGQRDKNWPDLPYHFLIAPDGRIFEGRPVNYEPESNTNYPLQGHVGIQLWGNFEEQRVSLAQLRSTVRLVAWLCQRYGIDPATIAGHEDVAVGQTDCPGRDFYRYIHDGLIRRWVEETLRGETPQIAELPPLPEGPTEFIPEN
jgi:hypothetical protein